MCWFIVTCVESIVLCCLEFCIQPHDINTLCAASRYVTDNPTIRSDPDDRISFTNKNNYINNIIPVAANL